MDYSKIKALAGIVYTGGVDDCAGAAEFFIPGASFPCEHTGGTDGCAEAAGFVVTGFSDPCEPVSITASLPAGTWYLWVSPAQFTGVECGAPYQASLSCGPGVTGATCLLDGTCADLTELEAIVMGGLYQGHGTTCTETVCPEVPPNDLCVDAESIDVPSVTFGSTLLTTRDSDVAGTFCGWFITSPGVWYSLTGTGNTVTASLCGDGTDYNTTISVFCGDCDHLTCLAGNNNFCDAGQSEVSFGTIEGFNYLILVHGFRGSIGNFELNVSDDGIPSIDAIDCTPIGACCNLITYGCTITTEVECDQLGGAWLGEDTQCGEFSYGVTPFDDDIEDISGFGGALGLGDDNGAVVPMGFTFNYYGDDYTDIAVCSNGYLTFGNNLNTRANIFSIPDPSGPNNMLAVYWDDLNPPQGGEIYSATVGTAPNRRFIAQWQEIPFYFVLGANTFQVILYEGTNTIEYRYGDFLPQPGGGGTPTTMGIENIDGTLGGSLFNFEPMPGDCFRFTPVPRVDPCLPLVCRGDCDGSGRIDFNDLVAMLFEFGSTDSSSACDADESGTVDFNDLVSALFAFGDCSRE